MRDAMNRFTASKDVYFIPFVGKDYERGLADGIKVLLLGESHYASDADTLASGRNCTVDYFGDYLTCGLEPANRFSGKLQRIVTMSQHATAEESNSAWNRVGYANFVQRFVGDGARQRPTPDHWMTGQPALTEMVHHLKPDVVLVLGSETWNHIKEGADSNETPIDTPKGQRSIWLIPHSNGFARASWTYHPATNMESTATAIHILRSLIERATTATAAQAGP